MYIFVKKFLLKLYPNKCKLCLIYDKKATRWHEKS